MMSEKTLKQWFMDWNDRRLELRSLKLQSDNELVMTIEGLRSEIRSLIIENEKLIREMEHERTLRISAEESAEEARKEMRSFKIRVEKMERKQDKIGTVIELVMVNTDLPRHKKDNIRAILDEQ